MISLLYATHAPKLGPIVTHRGRVYTPVNLGDGESLGYGDLRFTDGCPVVILIDESLAAQPAADVFPDRPDGECWLVPLRQLWFRPGCEPFEESQVDLLQEYVVADTEGRRRVVPGLSAAEVLGGGDEANGQRYGFRIDGRRRPRPLESRVAVERLWQVRLDKDAPSRLDRTGKIALYALAEDEEHLRRMVADWCGLEGEEVECGKVPTDVLRLRPPVEPPATETTRVDCPECGGSGRSEESIEAGSCPTCKGEMTVPAAAIAPPQPEVPQS